MRNSPAPWPGRSPTQQTGKAWAAVLREASAYEVESLYFGTQSGSFFALTEGDKKAVTPIRKWMWVEAVRHLPPVLSVEVAQWPR